MIKVCESKRGTKYIDEPLKVQAMIDRDEAIRDAADRCPYFAIELIPREPAEVSSVG